MQNFNILASGQTRFDQLYGMINAMFDCVRSQFSGVQFPANPTVGQPCYRIDMAPSHLFVFNGTDWVDIVSGSPAVAAAVKELADARGAAASLEARLDVSLNDDGTLKGNAPASDWWTEEADAVSRVSENQFSVAGDKRAIYTKRRSVKLEQATDAKSHVFDAVYNGSETIVSLTDGVVDSVLSGVQYGQETGNEPQALGFRQFVVEVTATDGRQLVALADHGLPSVASAYVPMLQVAGAVPYRATAQDVTPEAFTIRLFMPDGTPGAYVTSGIVTSGSGLRSGTGVRSGQTVPVRGVKVGCTIPM